MAGIRTRIRTAQRFVSQAMLRSAATVGARLPEPARTRFDLPTSVPWLEPTEDQLRAWAVAMPLDYQAWCFHHGFVTGEQWRSQRRAALDRPWEDVPLISILTPVYDTPVDFLRECVYSVMAQSYPYWELCLVDDASTDPATLAELDRLRDIDPRIRVERLDTNLGICGATNAALAMAAGEFIGFLDHDDRLAPDALHHVAGAVARDPRVDVIYSDRDMLTPKNVRTMHTLKPGWAPETLLSGNYLFHLTVYRRSLIVELGGYRAAYEGSQDFDLALRVSERTGRVAQIPHVLYHWRQHEGSMALLPESKPHIFAAGIAALDDALARRGLAGRAEENPLMWRGSYRVRLDHRDVDAEIVRVDDPAAYRDTVAGALARTTAEALVVLGPGVEPEDETSIAELLVWLQVPDVAGVTGRVVSSGGWLRHAGLVRSPDAVPLSVYEGHRRETPGYLAMTVSHRNVSLVHPYVCAWRVDMLRRAGGLPEAFGGPAAMLDASIAVAPIGRLVYHPLATFVSDDPGFSPSAWPDDERERLAAARAAELHDEPYYHWAFDRESEASILYVGAPSYPVDWSPPA